MGGTTESLGRRELFELGAAVMLSASLRELPAFAQVAARATGRARVAPTRGGGLTTMTHEAIEIVDDTLDNVRADWRHAHHIDIGMHRSQWYAADRN